MRRQGAADHRAAPDDRAHPVEARTIPTSRPSTSAPPRSIPKISIATVYRTVRLFEEAGILERHEFGDGRSRYEAASDAHHDHLIDVETGKVIEFVDEEPGGASEADRREARLPPRRPSHGAVRRRPRPRPLAAPLAHRRRARGRSRRRAGPAVPRLPAAASAVEMVPWAIALAAAIPRRGRVDRRRPRAGRRASRSGPTPCSSANHVSWLDILVLGGATGCAFVSKDKPRPPADPLAGRPESDALHPPRPPQRDRRPGERDRRARWTAPSRSLCSPKARPGPATICCRSARSLLDAVAPAPPQSRSPAGGDRLWAGRERNRLVRRERQGQCAARPRPQGDACRRSCMSSRRWNRSEDRKLLAHQARERSAIARRRSPLQVPRAAGL